MAREAKRPGSGPAKRAAANAGVKKADVKKADVKKADKRKVPPKTAGKKTRATKVTDAAKPSTGEQGGAVKGGAVKGGSVKASRARAAGAPRASTPAATTKGRPAAVAAYPGPPDLVAGDVVLAYVRTQATRFLDLEPQVRAGADDAVHQMRVAARRLRSGLRTFAPLVDLEWAADLAGELSWAAAELGGVRDLEVQLDRAHRHLDLLPPSSGLGPARVVLLTTLRRRLADAGVEAHTAFDSVRFADLERTLQVACTGVPLTVMARQPAGAVFPPLVDKAWRRLAKAVAALHSQPGTPAPDGTWADEEWHRARIQGKRARYAVEAVTDVFGAEAKAFARALALVTEELGEMQDAVVAEGIVGELRGPQRAAGVDDALGALAALERDAAEAAKARLLQVWPEVADPALRAWLRRR